MCTIQVVCIVCVFVVCPIKVVGIVRVFVVPTICAFSVFCVLVVCYTGCMHADAVCNIHVCITGKLTGKGIHYTGMYTSYMYACFCVYYTSCMYTGVCRGYMYTCVVYSIQVVCIQVLWVLYVYMCCA